MVTAAILLAAAGCGGDGEKTAEQAVPQQSAQPFVQPLPDGVVAATALPSSVANEADLRKQVTISACEKTAEGWQAAGTAANPGATASTYEVTVFFTTASATVIHWAQAKVDVQGGGSATWSLDEKFTAPPDTRCVLRGVGASR